jgi:hypothetical protein
MTTPQTFLGRVMEDKKYAPEQAIGIAVLSPFIISFIWVAFLPLTVFCAWCDRFIWNWFAAPYFHLAPMTLWMAVGIGLWIRLQTMQSKSVKGEKTETLIPIVRSIIMHVGSVLTAYVIHTHWR